MGTEEDGHRGPSLAPSLHRRHLHSIGLLPFDAFWDEQTSSSNSIGLSVEEFSWAVQQGFPRHLFTTSYPWLLDEIHLVVELRL